jgi:hypothetical protein
MENSEKYAHIKGWGIDADPKNDPTYPMKNYTGDDHNRLEYTKPPQQNITVEVLHSNERPGVTAVFGTSVPPSGLSGELRRLAFWHSEGSFAHWLTLLLADRVNVVEGLIDDLKKGSLPNIYKELGGNAALKYNRKGLIKKVITGALVSIFAILLISAAGKK